MTLHYIYPKVSRVADFFGCWEGLGWWCVSILEVDLISNRINSVHLKAHQIQWIDEAKKDETFLMLFVFLLFPWKIRAESYFSEPKRLDEKASINYFLVYCLKVGQVDGSSVNMIKVEPSN